MKYIYLLFLLFLTSCYSSNKKYIALKEKKPIIQYESIIESKQELKLNINAEEQGQYYIYLTFSNKNQLICRLDNKDCSCYNEYCQVYSNKLDNSILHIKNIGLPRLYFIVKVFKK